MKVVIPYYIFVTFTLIFHGMMFLPQYFFYSNFTEGISKPGGERLLVAYWFIENYIIYVVAFAATLSIPSIRVFASKRPWDLSLLLLIISLVVAVYASQHRTVILFNAKTSLSVAWMFLLGWSINQAKLIRNKHVVAIVGTFAFVYVPLFDKPNNLLSVYWIFAETAFLILLYFQEVQFPKAFIPTVSTIAGASMYIYISHAAVVRLFRYGGLLSGFAAVILSAIIGIALWKFSLWLEQLIARRARNKRLAI